MSKSFTFSGCADEFDERSPSLSSPLGRVDSIDSISKKISNLGTELTSFCPDNELVIDSYAGMQKSLAEYDDNDEFDFGNLKIDYQIPKQVLKRSTVSTREQEKKELNTFAGVYSLRTALQKNANPLNVGSDAIPLENNKIKRFSKISKDPSSVSKRPLLVELHTYPGFSANELTLLPASLSATYILDIVTRAQKDLLRKPSFKREFRKMFLSCLSQAVVQDTFWWFFLEKYQSCPEVQCELFNRVASNYVNLIISALEFKHREAFFKRYPSLVCQAIYTVFCRAFPTSYRQFDDRFKQDLIDVVYQWLVGTKPVRRCWEKWPLSFLEPEGMNMEEEIQKNVSKEFAFGLFDSESVQALYPPSQVGKSERRRTIWKPYEPERRRTTSKVYDNKSVREDVLIRLEKKSSSRLTNDRHEGLPDDDELARRKPLVKIDCESDKTLEIRKTSVSRLNISKSLQSTNTSNSSFYKGKKKRESCHAGKGPEFQKVVFDLHGQSPLVKHFLQNKHLAKDSGTSILVQRTEIDKLPPINAPTYQDIIKESLKSSCELEKQIQSLLEEMSNKREVFGRQQKKDRDEFRKRQSQVLSRHKDVKKISDLIMLRLSKGQTGENDQLIATSIANALKLDEDT